MFLSRELVLIGAMLLPGLSFARPGEHVRTPGGTVITPDVDVGLEFASNVQRAEADSESGVAVRVSPGLKVEADGSEYSVDLGGEYRLTKYLQKKYYAYDRFADFDLRGGLSVRPDRAVGFKIGEYLGYSNYPVDTGSVTPFISMFTSKLSPSLMLRPGPAMEFGVGFDWNFDDYSSAEGAQYDATGSIGRRLNTRNTFGPELGLTWSFFPRTAIVLGAEYRFNQWVDNWVLSTPGDGMSTVGNHLAMPDSRELRITGGIRGRFTNRIVLSVEGGYGRGTYLEKTVEEDAADEGGLEGDADFSQDVMGLDRLVLSARLRYELGQDTALTLGYERDFADSWFTNYVAYNRVYATAGARFSPRLGANASLSVRPEKYVGEVTRNDLALRAGGDVSYYLQDWAAVTLTGYWTERASMSGQSDVEYDDVRVMLKSTFTY